MTGTPKQSRSVRRRFLPSLGSFATFEVAAKHLSFTQAATELNVTQAAISQQIRALEKGLGARLFHRQHNALELTQEGRTLLAAVTLGLDALADAAARVGQSADESTITCAGTNAAITFWFRPMAARFLQSHPGTRFVLLSSDENDTLSNFEEVDMALICGNDRRPPGEDMIPLFRETVTPVCAPSYLERFGTLASHDDLQNAGLMELHRMHWASEAIAWYPLSWDDWFREHLPEAEPPRPVLTTNNYATLTEAALDGEGIMLGWHHLVEDLVQQGRLVRLFDETLDSGRVYYLKRNPARLDTPHVAAFTQMLFETWRVS